uniref:Uncharacterized protein n=1 Tax=Pseudomonas syringae group genomosp. 3 TaxID=251701 RepID=A0A330JVW8_9PSED|nr:hypothetical protein PSCFBP3800_P100038 [Pseudomonas syringae group genomosp. 3]
MATAPTSSHSDGIAGSQREYIHWLLETCTEGRVDAESILTEDAIDLLATKLRTPLANPTAHQPGTGGRLPDRRKTCLSGVGGIRAVAATG